MLICAAANSYGRYCGRDEDLEQCGQLWLCPHHRRLHEEWARRFVIIEQAEIRRENAERARARLTSEERSGCVYYLLVEREGKSLIKIGTTQKLAARMTDHRNGGQFTVVALLATHHGYYRAEAAIHARFQDERADLKEELFHLSDRLLAHVTHVQEATRARLATSPDPLWEEATYRWSVSPRMQDRREWPAVARPKRPADTPQAGRLGCGHGNTKSACSTCKCEARARAKRRKWEQAVA